MAGETGQQHFKLPYDAVISPRSSANDLIGAEDEQTVSSSYIAASLIKYQESLDEIARTAENRTRIVDEYNTVPLTGSATQSALTIQPTYELMPEKIESVIVAGPVAAVGTLLLGDRQIPFVIPASGVIVIAPVAILLNRNDPRGLTSVTAGIWFMELMGIADARFDA
jgi:hypothetical protein